MASIAKRPNGSWRARYRDAGGREYARHFSLKREAEDWLRKQQEKIDRGEWVAPERGRMLFHVFAREWLSRQVHLKPSTRARYEGILEHHLIPRWDQVPLSRIAYDDVARWVSELVASGLAASTVRQTHRVLSLILADAVKANRVARNVAEGVALPRISGTRRRYLTAEQVAVLADGARGQDRLIVLLLAYTGLRFGELAALKVGSVNLMRRRLEVVEAVSEVSGRLVHGTPKTHQQRTVVVPRFIADDLAAQVAGRRPDEPVFPAPGGGVLRLMNWRRRSFDPLVRAAGLEGLTPHELRHTAASLAVASGASVKDVQAMLGHASAAMTLDVYAGLFPDGLDSVADRLDVLARNAADSLRTEAQIRQFPPRTG